MSDSDYEEEMPGLPPLPGVSDGSGLKPASAAASVHDHLAMAHGGYHHYHDHHDDHDGLHLGGEGKIDSVEAAIMAVSHHGGIPPTSPITRPDGRLRNPPGHGKKERARCAAEGCDRQVSDIRFLSWFVCTLF